MALFRSIREHLVTLIRSEQGMALPTAIFAMIASMGLASAAILASVDVQQGSTRDAGAKKAIAAADAGANVALLRLNRFKNSLNATTPCIGPAGEAQIPTGGWCPATAPETVGPATYSYMVSAFKENSELSVVSVGTQDGVSRRIKVGLTNTEIESPFANEKLIGKDNVKLKGGVSLKTDLGTNGAIEKNSENGKDAVICGDLRHGVGTPAPKETNCHNKITEGEKDVPEVLPPANIGTENSNCRLSYTCVVSAYTPNGSKEQDTYCKNSCSKPNWNPETRTLEITSNNTLSMGGKDYFICRLLIKSGKLVMNAGSTIRVFFDTPEHCGLTAGAIRFELTANGSLTATGFDPNHGKYDVPGFYLLGSATIPTNVVLSGGGGATNEFILYGPNADVEMGGNAKWIGMMAGKTLTLHGDSTFESNPNIKIPEMEYETLFERTRYFECTGATASPPDADC